MERKLKERITGAIILFSVGILFIPALLDGEVNGATRTQPVPLPSATMTTVVVPTGDDRNRAASGRTSSPLPVAPSTEERAGVPESVATSKPATAEDRPAAAAPLPAAPMPRAMPPDPAAGWAVQVGSFESQDNANRLSDQLTRLGYKAFVSSKRLDGRAMYRVRVGPKPTRDEAGKLAERLRKDRQSVRVVPHPG
ncbi:MAG: SPOR domain-containing protein [Pseudomonadota bacterium]